MHTHHLHFLGWHDHFQSQLEALTEAGSSLTPARIAAQHRGLYTVLSATTGSVDLAHAHEARITGRLRHASTDEQAALPVVGDWVGLDDKGRIAHLFDRHTALTRKATGGASRHQALAANIDLIFAVTSLNQDFNLRRIERFITAIRSGGAEPVVVLSKADLAADPERFAAQMRRAAPHTEVVIVSALTGEGIDTLLGLLERGSTATLMGTSGVGKTTLLNALGGFDQATSEVRATDGRGRHTTRHRELFILPSTEALLIDTPGIRELQLAGDEDLSETFADIEALAEGCHFRDCSHTTEPSCAVQGAIDAGVLDPARLRSMRKLEREARRQAKRRSALERMSHKAHVKRFSRMVRRVQKQKEPW